MSKGLADQQAFQQALQNQLVSAAEATYYETGHYPNKIYVNPYVYNELQLQTFPNQAYLPTQMQMATWHGQINVVPDYHMANNQVYTVCNNSAWLPYFTPLGEYEHMFTSPATDIQPKLSGRANGWLEELNAIKDMEIE